MRGGGGCMRGGIVRGGSDMHDHGGHAYAHGGHVYRHGGHGNAVAAGLALHGHGGHMYGHGDASDAGAAGFAHTTIPTITSTEWHHAFSGAKNGTHIGVRAGGRSSGGKSDCIFRWYLAAVDC
jgi:hypothetical protein